MADKTPRYLGDDSRFEIRPGSPNDWKTMVVDLKINITSIDELCWDNIPKSVNDRVEIRFE
ncbi:hypothetical protein GX51_01447 [Blastomyces parvus]|uniref:Uncharacterized protein n=1 Tax=Blastomyces parvus TaxID=2060905 RepID=A0A2B7XH73_9EURO|nr:hypothetical protein GX51_01447 [Blastomyces parvus]